MRINNAYCSLGTYNVPQPIRSIDVLIIITDTQYSDSHIHYEISVAFEFFHSDELSTAPNRKKNLCVLNQNASGKCCESNVFFLKVFNNLAFLRTNRMIRSKTHRALTYFKPLNDSESNTKFVCEIDKCGSTIEARNRFNLVSHIKALHDGIYKSISSAESELYAASLQIKRLKLIQNLTEIVTVNGRAFAHLNDSGIIGLMSTDLTVLRNEGYASGITSPDYPAVKTHINYLASKIIGEIQSEVRGKFVSLLTDVGTKNRRDILGLALQYISEGRVKVRSIGMILLTTSHTAELIKNEIIKCLNVFGVTTDQVISITTDNAHS